MPVLLAPSYTTLGYHRQLQILRRPLTLVADCVRTQSFWSHSMSHYSQNSSLNKDKSKAVLDGNPPTNVQAAELEGAGLVCRMQAMEPRAYVPAMQSIILRVAFDPHLDAGWVDNGAAAQPLFKLRHAALESSVVSFRAPLKLHMQDEML